MAADTFVDGRWPVLRETFGGSVVSDLAGFVGLDIQIACAIALKPFMQLVCRWYQSCPSTLLRDYSLNHWSRYEKSWRWRW